MFITALKVSLGRIFREVSSCQTEAGRCKNSCGPSFVSTISCAIQISRRDRDAEFDMSEQPATPGIFRPKPDQTPTREAHEKHYHGRELTLPDSIGSVGTGELERRACVVVQPFFPSAKFSARSTYDETYTGTPGERPGVHVGQKWVPR